MNTENDGVVADALVGSLVNDTDTDTDTDGNAIRHANADLNSDGDSDSDLRQNERRAGSRRQRRFVIIANFGRRAELSD